MRFYKLFKGTGFGQTAKIPAYPQFDENRQFVMEFYTPGYPVEEWSFSTRYDMYPGF